MKLEKFLSFAISISMLIGLAACGNENSDEVSIGEPIEKGEEQPVVVSSDGQWLGKGGCYKLDRLSEGDYFAMEGSPVYLLGDLDKLYDKEGNLIYNGLIQDYAVVEDGIWCVCQIGMVNGEYNSNCYVMKLDFSGREISRFDISIQSYNLAVTDSKIFVYDSCEKILAVYNANGVEQGKINLENAEIEDYSGHLRTGGDGSIWLLSDVQSGLFLYPVDVTEMKLGSAYKLPENTESIRTGTPQHTFLLVTQDGLSYLDPLSDTVTNIMYWEECGIYGGELDNFVVDEDGFYCLSGTGLSRISPAKPEDIHPRIRLTLGTIMKYDGSSEMAAQFNAFNENYYVDVVDYSNNGKLSEEDAQTKLNTEILSGKGPDLVMIYDLDTLHNTFAFVDMYPLLDADSEFNREDLFALKALETSGKLMIAPSYLAISTFGALPEVAKGRIGWTWDDYFQVESSLPANGVMSSYLSAEFFLRNSVDLYAPTAIDWVNGTCNFNTPEFIRILEAAKKGYDPNCPEENPYSINEVNSMIANGSMILEGSYFFDVDSYAQNDIYNSRELDYIGWPTPDGSCGSVYYVTGISICAGTDCMEGSWEFVKNVFKNSYVYKPTFEKAITEATLRTTSEDEFALTQSQADRYRKLMENITVAASDGSTLSSIVLEEAAAMFSGDKSPEETAKVIQSRLSLYIAEHK